GRSGFRQAKDLTSVVMMRRVPAALALCWTGLLGACGGSSPKAEEPNGSRPMTREELQQQFLREADPIQKHPVKGGRAWRAYLEAVAPPAVEAQEGYTSVTADLGWESN